MSTIGETAMAPGDRVEDLFRREYPAMVGVASILLGGRSPAEDVVQEAFVRMLVKWPTVADERAGAYLRTTVLNLARGRLRRERVAGRQHRMLRLVGGDDAAHEAAAAGEEHRRVMGALAGLPRRQRECAVLRYYLELSEAEIAAALGVAPGSVKSHLSRARAALSLALEVQ